MSALEFIAVLLFGIVAVVADVAINSARVRLLGIETAGNENLIIRPGGDMAAVSAAVAAGAIAVGSLGKLIAAHVIIARPYEDLTALLPQ